MNTVIPTRDLALDHLPTATTSRLLVELVTDALGQSISVPVLVARSPRPGPTVGITAAVHGNELNGIRVIHRLFESMGTRLRSGTVVGLIVTNVPGLHAHQRDFPDGVDLNDVFPGRSRGNPSETYAHRLLERVVKHFDYLLDLHTASFGRLNSLYVRADMTDEAAAKMAYLQNPQIILHNPPSDGTLRGAAMDLRIPAITVEIADAHRFQAKYIRTTLLGVQSVLVDLGVLKRKARKPGPEPVLCDRSYWIHTDRGGLLDVSAELSANVTAGDVVARVRDAFGDLRAEYKAPEDGIVIGKSVNPVGQTGARVIHLGIVADESAASYVRRHDEVEERRR